MNQLNRTQLLPDRPGVPPMAQLPDPETVDPAALAQAYARGETDLICVLGPTASGKTRYAVQLARALRSASLGSSVMPALRMLSTAMRRRLRKSGKMRRAKALPHA